MDEARPDFEALDAVEQIRQRHDLFFRAGTPTAAELLERVKRDVGARTREHTLVEEGRFHLVGAEVDWLDTPEASVMELFNRFVGDRAEVLLNAVCAGVFTDGPAGVYGRVLQREDLPPRLAAEADRAVR